MEEKSQEIDLGENRTVFSATNEEIKSRGVRMCDEHKWRKVNDIELACTVCPTQIICAIDDERLIKSID